MNIQEKRLSIEVAVACWVKAPTAIVAVALRICGFGAVLAPAGPAETIGLTG
jgi:hypothetical protein